MKIYDHEYDMQLIFAFFKGIVLKPQQLFSSPNKLPPKKMLPDDFSRKHQIMLLPIVYTK